MTTEHSPPTDNDVRLRLYQDFVARGEAPTVADIARALDASEEAVAASFERLAASRVIVLRPGSREVLMVNPLSAVPTRFRVTLADGRGFYGNCVWDAMGIAAMLGSDADIAATCPDCDEPLQLAVRGGALAPTGTSVHFAVPAARWWEDIVFT